MATAAITLCLSLLCQEPPKSGKFRGEIVDPASGDGIMKVRMQIPDPPKEGKKWGFIFVCHGFKGSEGNSYLDGTVAALKRAGLDQDYLVVAGKSKGDGWTAEDDARFLRLYAWAKEAYPVDPERLILFGSSNGARWVCLFGMNHEDLVRGVVSYCGNTDFSKLPFVKRPADATLPDWYFVHGGLDHPEQSRRTATELRERGYHAVFRQLDGYGHTGIWDGKDHPEAKLVDEVRDDWVAWLSALPHAGGKLSSDAAAAWGYDFALPKLVERAKAKDLAAIQSLGRVARLMLAGSFEDKSAIWTLVFLLGDDDQKVREAAFGGLEQRVPDTFGYSVTLPAVDRMASLAKWTQWCTSKCGPP